MGIGYIQLATGDLDVHAALAAASQWEIGGLCSLTERKRRIVDHRGEEIFQESLTSAVSVNAQIERNTSRRRGDCVSIFSGLRETEHRNSCSDWLHATRCAKKHRQFSVILTEGTTKWVVLYPREETRVGVSDCCYCGIDNSHKTIQTEIYTL